MTYDEQAVADEWMANLAEGNEAGGLIAVADVCRDEIIFRWSEAAAA